VVINALAAPEPGQVLQPIIRRKDYKPIPRAVVKLPKSPVIIDKRCADNLRMTGAVGSLVGDATEARENDPRGRTGGVVKLTAWPPQGIIEILRRTSQRRTFAVPLIGLGTGEM